MAKAAIRDLAASAKRALRDGRNHAHVVRWDREGDVRSLRCECGAIIVARGGRAWLTRVVPG